MAAKIFISYRRDDSRYQARMIHAAFCRMVAHDDVFMDVDSIPPGANFRKILKDWVDRCDILLALVGPGWIDATDPKTGLRRLENPSDFVRIEIAEALARGIPVVPVLLDGAPVPDADLLPSDLKELVDRQAEFVEYRTFDADVGRLLNKLKLGQSTGPAVSSGPQSPAATPPPIAPVQVASRTAPAPPFGTYDVIFEVGIWRIERPARSVGFYLWVDSGETAIEMLGAGIDAWNLRKSFKEATFITGIRTYAEPSAFDLRPWEHSTNPVFPITSDSYRSEDGMIVDITAGKIHITMWEGQIHLDTQSSDILFKDTYGRTFLFSNSVYPTEI